jgi:putative peptidoglycan lipid II flippase
MQLNVWVNTLIATMIPGAVAYLYFADRLSQFPLALIGTALGTVLLPTIAAQLKGGKREECLHTQEQAFLLSQTLTLPAAAGLLVLAQPIIVALFARGEFSLDAAAATAKALQAYSLGLPAFVLVKLYAPMYFAQGDTRTPVKFAFICLLLNVCLNLLSVRWFGHFGLALSTSFCSWVNVFLLALGLRKSGLLALSKDSMRKFFKLLLATIFMGLSVEFLELALEKELSSHWLRLAICCSVGGILYGLAVLLLRIYNPLQLKKLLRRR